MNPNHILVDVGVVSSDHDRACEVFYQLMGGRVDYGEAHAKETHHDRYGYTYELALHPHWGEDNPIHLVGHSFGATTAIELYQMLCDDAFGVGSNHKWVRSIVCIAAPLTGSTLSHMVGLDDTEMKHGSLVHLLGFVVTLWFKLYTYFPVLKSVYDYRMPQWGKFSYLQLTDPNGRINKSLDMAVFSSLPAQRIQRNSRLKYMDKLYLMSIATSPHALHFPKRECAAFVVLVIFAIGKFPKWWPRWAGRRSFRAVLITMVAYFLRRRLQQLDIGKIPSLYGLAFLMRRRARTLPQIFDGFDPTHWEHNDGIVNVQSMIQPWFPKPQEISDEEDNAAPSSPTAAMTKSASSASISATTLARCESHISIDGFHQYWEEDHAQEEDTNAKRKRFQRGRWYLYRVKSNHFAGTYFDNDAVDLYKSLFTLMKREYEAEDKAPEAHSLPDQIRLHGLETHVIGSRATFG